MKRFGFVIALACAGLGAGCESTDMAADSRAEKKQIGALQRQSHEAQIAEADRNLWNAQRDILLRDGNPNLHYY